MSIMAQAKGKDTIFLSRNGCAGSDRSKGRHATNISPEPKKFTS